MDAKSRADFLNSLASGETVECPNCGAVVASGKKFCRSCGYNFAQVGNTASESPTPTRIAKPNSDSPFAPAEQTEIPHKPKVSAPVSSPTSGAAFLSTEEKASDSRAQPVADEPTCAFAQGLPSWSITPPQTMVRKKGRK